MPTNASSSTDVYGESDQGSGDLQFLFYHSVVHISGLVPSTGMIKT